MNLANCPRCGKVFARGVSDVCPACNKEIDKEYEKCANYLRENKGASITLLSEETGVTIRQITRFIKEGRISLLDAPNLSYPCESCGVLIQSGNLCENCRRRFVNASKNLFEQEEQTKKLSTEQLRDVYKGLGQYKERKD